VSGSKGREAKSKAAMAGPFDMLKGKLPPVVDLAFASRISHYGNGNERAATREGNFGQG